MNLSVMMAGTVKPILFFSLTMLAQANSPKFPRLAVKLFNPSRLCGLLSRALPAAIAGYALACFRFLHTDQRVPLTLRPFCYSGP